MTTTTTPSPEPVPEGADPLWLRPSPPPEQLAVPSDAPYRQCLTCEVTWRGDIPCWVCGGETGQARHLPTWWGLAAVAFRNSQSSG